MPQSWDLSVKVIKIWSLHNFILTDTQWWENVRPSFEKALFKKLMTHPDLVPRVFACIAYIKSNLQPKVYTGILADLCSITIRFVSIPRTLRRFSWQWDLLQWCLNLEVLSKSLRVLHMFPELMLGKKTQVEVRWHTKFPEDVCNSFCPYSCVLTYLYLKGISTFVQNINPTH